METIEDKCLKANQEQYPSASLLYYIPKMKNKKSMTENETAKAVKAEAYWDKVEDATERRLTAVAKTFGLTFATVVTATEQTKMGAEAYREMRREMGYGKVILRAKQDHDGSWADFYFYA